MAKSISTQLTLTRYLYIKDEVKYCILLSLLDKKSIDVVLYWVYELYYSGYEEELFEYVRYLYFDFYALSNPKFYNFIDKQYSLWLETNDDIIIGFIFKNLFMLPSSHTIFCIRQYILNGGTCKSIYKGRKPTWLLKYKNTYHNVLRSIKNKSFIDIYYYLSKLNNDDIKHCLYEVGKYFENEEGKDIPQEFYDTYDEAYDDMIHKDISHVWICTILNLMEYEPVKEEKKHIYVKLSKTEIESIRSIERDLCKPRYKTLQFKRLYGIHKDVKYFRLMRNNFKLFENYNFIDEIQHHWLYYCRETPRYKDLLNKYQDVVVNHEKREIIFKNDDDLEHFYENYGYFEPDEQNNETIQKVFKYDDDDGNNNENNVNINTFVNDTKLNITFDLTLRFIY